MNIIKRIIEIMRGRVRLANEALANLVGCANEVSDNEWLQLAPLGDFPHAQGMQRVDRTAIEAMANHFNGILASAKRALFGGVPFFEGHPDVAGLSNEYRDKTAKGWIKALEARADGLYGRVEWNPRGKELITNKEYKFFSPYWEAAEAGRENSRTIYRPVQLLSVGLTNTPNLPVRPLANDRLALAPLANILGVAESSPIEDFQAAATQLANTAAEAQRDLANVRAELANERTERIKLILDNAIVDKRLTIAERPEWESKFTSDFANAQTALSARKQTDLNTESQTKDLGKDKRTFENEATRRNELNAYIQTKLSEGMTYEQAWQLAKKERAALFEQMKK